MNVLDSKRVVVSDSLELKTVLEEDNLYNYIYFDNDIVLDSGIVINENKRNVVINGTYLDVRHSFTGISGEDINDSIIASYLNLKVTIKNVDIIVPNSYGMVCGKKDSIYSDFVLEYNNVIFNGVELGYNPYGKCYVINSNITIKDMDGVLGQEAIEANNVFLSGNVTFNSSSANFPLFSYRNDISDPSLIILPNSTINIVVDTMALINGTNKLLFNVLHDSVFNLTTGNGFATLYWCGAKNVLIDERAVFNFIENYHQRVPMWAIYDSLTVNEGAKFFVINTYNKTPTDNYNIYFRGNNPIVNFNNPDCVIFYNLNANIIYSLNEVQFNLNFSRINMWNDSISFSSSGSIDNLPDYAWYKEEGLCVINGSFTNSSTVISNHNFSSLELSSLDSLDNFTFQNKKQLSIGSSYINIDPLLSTKNVISGYVYPHSKVLIEYKDNSYIVSSDSDGKFVYNLSDNLVNDDVISFTSSLDNSFVYKKRIVTVPFEGELSLVDAPSYITFSLNRKSLDSLIFERTKEMILKIIDSRVNSSYFSLYVSITSPLKSKNDDVLFNALIFKKFNNDVIVLNEVPSLVYTGSDNGGSTLVTNLTWSISNGILLDLTNLYLLINEEYFAKIIFSIE